MNTTAEKFVDAMNARRFLQSIAFDPDSITGLNIKVLSLRFCVGSNVGENKIEFIDGSAAEMRDDGRWKSNA